jgi:hypothetical protein
MCPACVTALALLAAGAGSSGGLAALVTNKLRAKRRSRTKKSESTTPIEGEHDGSPESRVAG